MRVWVVLVNGYLNSIWDSEEGAEAWADEFREKHPQAGIRIRPSEVSSGRSIRSDTFNNEGGAT